MTRGPREVSARPTYRTPTNGVPADASRRRPAGPPCARRRPRGPPAPSPAGSTRPCHRCSGPRRRRDSLEVLCGAERHDGHAVAEAEERHLGTGQVLLDDDRTVGLRQAGAGVLECLLPVVGHDDTLAGSEPVVLDDMRRTQGVEGLLDRLDRRADVRQPGGHLGRGHDVLGEGLAALEARRLGGRTEARDARRPNGVRHSGDERRLRADHDEVRARPAGEGDDGLDIGGPAGEGLARRERGDAGVARRRDHLVDRGVQGEGADDGVLTGPGPDDEYLHGPQCRGGVDGPTSSRARDPASGARLGRRTPHEAVAGA